MNVVIFGGTGMIGQGALRACLADPGVGRVLAVGRNPVAVAHPKLRGLVVADLFDLDACAADLTGYDACLYALGPSAAGMDAAAYARVTHDLTLSVAAVLARLNPGMTFVFVSGVGAGRDARAMWARVKARTEDALRSLPFARTYAFRPAVIQPRDGIRSRTPAYRVLYPLLGPLLTLLRQVVPQWVLTTDNLGRA